MSEASNWTYIPRSEYKAPGFAAEAVRSVLSISKALRNKLTGAEEDDGAALMRPSELRAGLVPEIDVDAAAAALTRLLSDDFGNRSQGSGLRVVIGPPGSSVAGILTAVAQANGWPEFEEPDRSDLLHDTDDLGVRLRELGRPTEGPIVVSRLERWFLRQDRALPIIRAAVETLAQRTGAALVGCDSWAWAFLERSVGIESMLGEPLVLAPLDGAKLSAWLGEPFQTRDAVCMRAGSTENLFGAGGNRKSGAQGDSAEPQRPHSHLDQLAAAARGNPGVALALWSRSLREVDKKADSNELMRAPLQEESSWWAVSAADAEIALPADLDDVHRFALHASLLHGGLPLDLLKANLPFPGHDVLRRAQSLRSAGVFVERDGDLVVAEAAYVAVRRHLASRGFLADDF